MKKELITFSLTVLLVALGMITYKTLIVLFPALAEHSELVAFIAGQTVGWLLCDIQTTA